MNTTLTSASMQGLPPRHTTDALELAAFGEPINMQLNDFESRSLPIDPREPADSVSGATAQPRVSSDCDHAEILTQVDDEIKEHKKERKGRWYRDMLHAVVLYCRDTAGRSIAAVVPAPVACVVEFPVTHARLRLHARAGVQLDVPLQAHAAGCGRRDGAAARAPTGGCRTRPTPPAAAASGTRRCGSSATRSLPSDQDDAHAAVCVDAGGGVGDARLRQAGAALAERGLRPGAWVTARLQPMEWACTRADVEGWCGVDDVEPNPAIERLAPMTLLAWDIEVVNGDAAELAQMQAAGIDRFPQARRPTNQIVQISIILELADNNRRVRLLLELDDDAENPGEAARAVRQPDDAAAAYYVVYFQAERDMLCYFRDVISWYDPDVIATYNGDCFDWPYLIARMGDVAPSEPHGRFYQPGRWLWDYWHHEYVPFKSKTYPSGIKRDAPAFGDDELPRKRVPLGEVALQPGCNITARLPGVTSCDIRKYVQDQAERTRTWR